MNEKMTTSRLQTESFKALQNEPEISADWVEFFKEARRLARKVEAAAKVSSEHETDPRFESGLMFTERKVA